MYLHRRRKTDPPPTTERILSNSSIFKQLHQMGDVVKMDSSHLPLPTIPYSSDDARSSEGQSFARRRLSDTRGRRYSSSGSSLDSEQEEVMHLESCADQNGSLSKTCAGSIQDTRTCKAKLQPIVTDRESSNDSSYAWNTISISYTST